MSDRPDITIPEEAREAAAHSYMAATGWTRGVGLYEAHHETVLEQSWFKAIVEAAAPLIVAVELERLAEDMQARAVARHQIGEDNGSECDEDCELSGCHASAAADTYTLTRDRLRLRAAELRGGTQS